MRVGDGLERLVYTLDTHPIKAEFALLYQVIEDAKDVRHVVGLVGRAVELQEVKSLHLQVMQAPLDKAGQVLASIACSDMGTKSPSSLRRNDDFLAACLAELGNQLLRVPITIHICGINEVHPQVNRL